jgi:outer membrane protein TolC
MIRRVAGLLPGLLFATVAFAQEPAVPLTLDEAVARAVAYSQRLAEAAAREEGARAAIRSRESGHRPTVTVSGGYIRTNHVEEFGVPQSGGNLRLIYPDIPNNYSMRAAMQWPIFTAGRTDALVRAAEAEARAASAEIEVARADLRLEVTRAYWALVSASEAVRVVQEGLTRADAHLRDVRSRFQNGLIPPNDVSSVEAQRAREEMQLIEARNLQQSIMEDLRRLTGIAGDIVPAEPLASAAPAAASAGERRAELVALDARIAAADERVEAIRATRRPMLAVAGAADYANPNPRIFPREEIWQTSWEVGITGTWTLWDGGRTEADTAEAHAAARALRSRQLDLTRLIDTDVRQRQRVATSTELLDAHMALLQAELDRTRALASIRLAEARLDRALGR